MNNLQIFFSDYFEVDEDVVETYGAVNISLLNDMPLFIDPFLLFNSEKAEYQASHSNIIKYLLFLQEQANAYPTPPAGMLESWFAFSEVKQTWLGFSLSGNAGRGLGRDFAMNLYRKNGVVGAVTIFKEGDSVRIDDPLFQGYNGTVLYIDHRKQRAKLQFHFDEKDWMISTACDVLYQGTDKLNELGTK